MNRPVSKVKKRPSEEELYHKLIDRWTDILEEECNSRIDNLEDPEMVAAVHNSLLYLLAVTLSVCAKDHGHLLDGLSMSNDRLRQLACEMFVDQLKKLRR